MTTSWLELKHPLEPHFVALLGDLDDVLQAEVIPYLLSGAMAREIVLHYGHECARGRRTTDLDFGVTVKDWKAYEALKAALVASGRFRLDAKESQRVIHRDAATGMDTRVDLVPFGAIARTDGTIAWPPDGAHVMHVLGYEEALASVIRLKVDATHANPMASAAGQAILKLVAYRDRGARTHGRDAVDFYELLSHHADTLTDAQLYDEFPEAMARYEFRPEPAGAWILGRQVAAMVKAGLKPWIQDLFRSELRARMITHMLLARRSYEDAAREGDAAHLVEAFDQGFHSAG
ncbi:nucleotidyl transferase AbiEii/AbiGii toxin family protein [Geothrix mesophila]|uniref:nucleotidyl transferase AbiEii/AbiGii toxin family protein n=1 Tax=Geothrix mesophila TaxID=2922723 RepID=UPI001FAC7BA7|nr:nucleotidyl transferase AbiEii/AbiGii toxin family protein [Geothrix sp. SG198]